MLYKLQLLVNHSLHPVKELRITNSATDSERRKHESHTYITRCQASLSGVEVSVLTILTIRSIQNQVLPAMFIPTIWIPEQQEDVCEFFDRTWSVPYFGHTEMNVIRVSVNCGSADHPTVDCTLHDLTCCGQSKYSLKIGGYELARYMLLFRRASDGEIVLRCVSAGGIVRLNYCASDVDR